MDTVFDYYKPIIQMTYMSKDKQGNNLPELPRDVSITIFEYTRPDIIRKLRDKSLENILMERLTPFCKLLSKNKIAYVTSFITRYNINDLSSQYSELRHLDDRICIHATDLAFSITSNKTDNPLGTSGKLYYSNYIESPEEFQKKVKNIIPKVFNRCKEMYTYEWIDKSQPNFDEDWDLNPMYNGTSLGVLGAIMHSHNCCGGKGIIFQLVPNAVEYMDKKITEAKTKWMNNTTPLDINVDNINYHPHTGIPKTMSMKKYLKHPELLDEF
jgi:hypothetical protein